MKDESRSLKAYLEEKRQWIDASLHKEGLPSDTPEPLKEAMAYSLFAGGKRLRPVLLLATLEALGEDPRQGVAAACAVELIHTYSLIHDDLPAMDDDDYRRGKPTNHKQFGEAIAILAGDALLTQAFFLIAERLPDSVSAEQRLRLTSELAYYAGPRGMVGGQTSDLLAENQRLSAESLRAIHDHKTSDLLVFCVRAGAILAGADEARLKSLTVYARHIGQAFQIQDDILDVVGTADKLGKDVGRDAANHKSTYPALLGLEPSKQEVKDRIDRAKTALVDAGVEDGARLLQLAEFIKNRDS